VRHYELGSTGAIRLDVGREDPEAAAAATVFFDDDIFGWHERRWW
jgi:hypothetical protein